MAKIYLTTTLPYVNSDPHIGFALEIVQADIIARYLRLLGNDVLLNTGTDEHGVKIYTKAFDIKESAQEYVDRYAKLFRAVMDKLDIDTSDKNFNFIRTTDEHHIKAAQEFWRRCLSAGDIYKKNYKAKYCTGCEMEKHDSEIENGHCFLHPNLDLQIIEEENYFFRFSKYQDALLHIYESVPDFVLPASRLNEIRNFVKNGLEDFSISRLASKMPWGIPVPDDADHVMYVWFDALVNYVSAIGWPSTGAALNPGGPDDTAKFDKWWPVVQLAGKDNLRQQSAMWQAMLLSAGIEPSKQILIHGFINVAGQKMSKSLGNVVNPFDLIESYGVDALRYYLAREITPFEDGDYTDEKFKQAYNSELANGVGNLTSRVLKMAESYEAWPEVSALKEPAELIKDDFYAEFRDLMSRYELSRAADFIWTQIKEADLYIQNTKPFSVYKTDLAEAKKQVVYLVEALWRISVALVPFLPSTAEKIQTAIREHKMPEPLFLRKE